MSPSRSARTPTTKRRPSTSPSARASDGINNKDYTAGCTQQPSDSVIWRYDCEDDQECIHSGDTDADGHFRISPATRGWRGQPGAGTVQLPGCPGPAGGDQRGVP